MVDAHIHYKLFGNCMSHDIDHLYHIIEKYDIEKMLLIDIEDDWYVKGRYKWDYGTKIMPGFILHPNDKKAYAKIKALKEKGIRFIKYIPYEQNILREDYGQALELAYQMEKEEMCLIIDASYGSKNIYRTNGVELTEYLLRNGIRMPLIVAHGGMLKILDLYSLMCEYENVYFDISFALQFWWGSSLIMDYAYVLKKMDYKRVFYGSDYPFVSQETSLKYFNMFCEKYEINDQNRDQLLQTNFLVFLNQIGERKDLYVS